MSLSVPVAAPVSGVRIPAMVLGAAALFGLCNVAWRFGEGSAATLAATRAAAGLLLFSPVVIRVLWSGALVRALRDATGLAACLLSGATLWAAALMFRSIPGPAAAATIALLPVVTLLVGRLVGTRRTPRRAILAMAVATTAALFAATPVHLTRGLLVPVLLFLAVEVASLLVAERARQRHEASTLVMGGLLLGAVPAPLLWAGMPVAESGLWAAGAVAVLGTLGRLLKSHTQATVSAAVVGSSTQVTALVTALGGVALFADALTAPRLAALLVGAAAASAAVWWCSPNTAAGPPPGADAGSGPDGGRGGRVSLRR